MQRATILISANAEWRAVKALFPHVPALTGPFGEMFLTTLAGWQCRFRQGGWGKISAAASAQHAIDHDQPELLVNLGTCGGFSGEIERGEIVLAERTLVYDILEQMGDQETHIAHYTTQIDLSWLSQPYPHPVRSTLLVSGDRDLLAGEIPMLKEKFQAVAGDWESGAIAWVASRSNVRLLILRGVTDLVDGEGSAAYGNLNYFENAAFEIMRRLVKMLPDWLAAYR